jgi:hypothetical protein
MRGVWAIMRRNEEGESVVVVPSVGLEAAIADLRDALEALLAEVGPPDELTLTLDVA